MMRFWPMLLCLLFSACGPEEQISYKMTVSPDELSFPVEGGSTTVTLSSDMSWKARCDADWITCEPAKGLKGKTEVTVTVGQNFDAARMEKIIFASPNDIATATLKITQDKREGAIDAADVPDKVGMTIKGLVVCGGLPVAGVTVSDGVEAAQTDSDGCFWLPSKKKLGYVFISVPGGYKTPRDGAYPIFWQATTAGADEVEAHKFTLESEDQSKVRLIAATDLHLADRYSSQDLRTYKADYLSRLETEAAGDGTTYGIVLGDMTWDIFWDTYDLARYRREHHDLPLPVWHVIGNHDYDMSYTDDAKAAGKFFENFGPTYYSFNLGKAHFVVLDNIVYLNENSSRHHDTYVDNQQMSWLKKDLSFVGKDTPLFVCMHCAMFHSEGISKSGAPSLEIAFDPEGWIVTFLDCFKGYTNVHVLAGDTHINNSLPPEAMPSIASNIYQHNIAAVCASWWWTTYESGNSICKDGSEGGYEVFNIGGGDINWYYQPMHYPASKQFRTYDMNVVKHYFATSTQAAQFHNAYPSRETYSSWGDDIVLINVWAWDPRWTISITENGMPLEYEFIMVEDPLHTISYDIPRTVENGELTSSFRTTPNHHMIKVKTSGPDTSLEITVTDPFGNVSAETMTRPKAFNVDMP